MTARADSPPSRRMPLSLAFGIALATEMLILGIVTWRLQSPHPSRPRQPATVMRVEHVDLPAPTPIAPTPPRDPAPTSPVTPKPIPPKPVPPRPALAKPRQPIVPQAPRVEPVIAPTSVASAPPVETAPPPVPATPAPAAAAKEAQQEAAVRFETLLRAAVQEAARFPAAAKAMGRQGRVRVGFDFQDGHVSTLQVVQSGDFPPFDQAALAAVEDALYPPAPAHLRHQMLHLTVWVEFLKKGY